MCQITHPRSTGWEADSVPEPESALNGTVFSSERLLCTKCCAQILSPQITKRPISMQKHESFIAVV